MTSKKRSFSAEPLPGSFARATRALLRFRIERSCEVNYHARNCNVRRRRRSYRERSRRPCHRADRRRPNRQPRLHLRQRSLAVQDDGTQRYRPTHGTRCHRRRRSRRGGRSHHESRRCRRHAVRVFRRHLRLLPRSAAYVMHPRRILRHRWHGRRTGRSAARPFGGRNTLRTTGRQRRRADAVPSHSFRRDGDGKSCGRRRQGRSGEDSGGRRRRRRWVVRRHRVRAAPSAASVFPRTRRCRRRSRRSTTTSP